MCKTGCVINDKTTFNCALIQCELSVYHTPDTVPGTEDIAANVTDEISPLKKLMFNGQHTHTQKYTISYKERYGL